MDNFKQDLRDKRESLDTEMPSAAVWERIAKQQPVAGPKIVPMIMRYAAAACIIAFVAGGIYFLNNKTGGDIKNIAAVNDTTAGDHAQIAQANPPGEKIPDSIPVLSANDPAVPAVVLQPVTKPQDKKKAADKATPDEIIVRDLQNNYAQLVNMQVARLNKMPVYAVSDNYFNTFKDQLKSLDSGEVSLRREIRKYGLNDELLQQLININQQKLNVLKTLQSEINKINNRVLGDRPKQDSMKTSYLNI